MDRRHRGWERSNRISFHRLREYAGEGEASGVASPEGIGNTTLGGYWLAPLTLHRAFLPFPADISSWFIDL